MTNEEIRIDNFLYSLKMPGSVRAQVRREIVTTNCKLRVEVRKVENLRRELLLKDVEIERLKAATANSE